MDTPIAVIVSQIPLGIACIIAAYELRKLRKLLEETKASFRNIVENDKSLKK